ncbi:MAG: radical SAM protein [Desulfobacteraceae bacterium]|nr:radical SAM protein [Desulfobacteraceae bacterium]
MKKILNREQLSDPNWKEGVTWEIHATTACNLQCTYCYNRDKQYGAADPVYSVEELVAFFKKYSKKGDYVSFMGGEPLIRKDWISGVIAATENFGFEYEVYTNGINIGELSPDFVNKFNAVLISVDGDEEQNDRSRGKGVFSKIIQNLKTVRSYYQGTIIARMTITGANDLEKSLKAILSLPYFDMVYWQYENHEPPADYPVEKKWKELKGVLELWMENLKQGRVLPVQTFLSVTARLLNQENYQVVDYSLPPCTLACGAGHHYIQIATTGDIYACPEIIEQDNNLMGNIREGIFRRIDLKAFSNTHKCYGCPEFEICHCRCIHCTPDVYCTLIKRVISALRKEVPAIKEMIDSGRLNKEDFHFKEQMEEMF